MKTTALVLVLFCLCSSSLFAQNPYIIKGLVIDTLSSSVLRRSAVIILNDNDTTLVKFGWTGSDGSFSINNLQAGKLILLVTYPGYADYVEKFSLDPVNPSHDFGKLVLVSKARLLAEIVINRRSPIVIKGDTTEFNQGSFVVQPNSKVEDLLKQLPGISVDNNGTITAQGRTVKKVLIDGEEFFSDDPTMVTRNVRGDMIDKIQLYDKKSDQATFTEVDDGVKETTLNVVLKEDKKTGYFGKASGGGGSNLYYQGQGMVNAFQEKSKFAVYGTISNTASTGLGYDDSQKLGFTFGVDEVENFGTGGLPQARNGGAHFDTKWNKGKESINVDYKIGSLEIENTVNSFGQQNLLQDIIKRSTDTHTNNTNFRQRLNAIYQGEIDSTSNLRLTFNSTLRTSESKLSETTSAFRGDDSNLSFNNRTSSNTGDNKNLTSSALWNKRLRKKGRTISLNVNQSFNKGLTKGYLNSSNELFDTQNHPYDTLRVDQYKTNNNTSFSLGTNLNFNEPLSKTLTASLNYGFGINHSLTERRSFNRSGAGHYTIRDSIYSNHIDFDQTSNNAGLNFNYKKDKTTLSFGTSVSAIKQIQVDRFIGTEFRRNFLNWSPQARYSYSLSQQSSFSMNYTGNTSQPSIESMHAVRTNDDPLNIRVGNPDLKPTFNSSLSINYNSYKALKARSFYVNGNFGLIPNPISNSVITDAAGQRISQSVNINDKANMSYSLNVGYSGRLKKSQHSWSVRVGSNGNNTFNLQNTDLNKISIRSYSATFSLGKEKLGKYNLYFGGVPGFNTTKSTLQKQYDLDRWTFSTYGGFTLYLPGKLEVTSAASYSYVQTTQTFNNSPNPIIWNSSISKKFLKSQALRLTITGNDLLNQNTGFSTNGFNQTNSNTIKRYFIGSLTWDFSKMGAIKKN